VNKSIHALFLKNFECRLCSSQEKVTYTDLNYLAGTWTRTDEKEFEKNTRFFETIDEEL
jgi:hypothetical protein